VALIDYDVTVLGNEVRDGVLTHDVVEHRNVDCAADGTLSSAERLRIDIEEQRALRDPLVENQRAVHEEAPGHSSPASRSE